MSKEEAEKVSTESSGVINDQELGVGARQVDPDERVEAPEKALPLEYKAEFAS